MIANLQPYSSYKPSGVEWLGDVPAHWEVVRLCSVSQTKSIANQQHRELLSVYLDQGVIRFSDVTEKRTNPTSEDLSKYQVVDPGDFVLNNQQAWRGSVGVSNFEGIVSPAYLVLALSSRLDPQFANLLFRDNSMVGQYVVCSKGVGTIQRNLYWPHLKRILTLVPPLPEQTAIVRYLDHVDERIRRYVSGKQKLIRLLDEEKRAVISQAVTGQVDVCTGQPYKAYKPSGIPWLGDVPAGWEVVRLCAVSETKSIVNQQHRELLSVYLDQGVIKFSDVKQKRTNPTSEDLSKYQAVDPGDFVLNNQQAWRGSVGVSNFEGIVSPAYLVLALSSRLDPQFANLLFRDNSMVGQYVVCSKGVGTIQRNLYWPHLKGILTFVPPLPEQTAIVRYLDKATAAIDTAVSRAHRQIELLQEYRTRLIADVVTGQLDVREAAGIPEVDSLEIDPGLAREQKEVAS